MLYDRFDSLILWRSLAVKTFAYDWGVKSLMALLGEDGIGYELAKKLESNGSWRAWLGNSHYALMAPHLTTLSAWKNFMHNTEGSKAQIYLQLRVRALLFDKATVSLHLRSSSASLASLHPTYLQLHADDVYYSLEEDVDDWHRLEAEGTLTAKALQMKVIEGTSCARSRFTASEVESVSSRFKNGEILDTWYGQWREKHLMDRMQRFSWRLAQQELPFGDRDTFKRTPEGMSAYLMCSQKHRKKDRVTKLDQKFHSANSSRENVPGIQAEWTVETNCSLDEEICFFPETMFPSNCVPDNSVPGPDKEDENPNVELPGIFENLPYETSRSPLLIERFGMGSEYLSLGNRKVENIGKNRVAGKRRFSEEEAAHRARQTVVRIVAGVGFEGLKEGSMDVLSQLLSCHICKLGRVLRLLADSFRNEYSQIELLRMFLQTIGYSNLGTLTDYMKSGKRLSPQQIQQQLVRVTPHTTQQLQRQTSQQIQLLQPQNVNLATQPPQWDKTRRKQPLTPRSSGRKLEKDRTTGDIKLETSNDFAVDCKVAAPLVSQHHAQWQQQQQQQQQQQSIQASHHPQSLSQFKQHSSLQLPQIQQQSLFSRDTVQFRTQPVKVEGFQELMGGDVSVKETDDEIGRTLLSPRKL